MSCDQVALWEVFGVRTVHDLYELEPGDAAELGALTAVQRRRFEGLLAEVHSAGRSLESTLDSPCGSWLAEQSGVDGPRELAEALAVLMVETVADLLFLCPTEQALLATITGMHGFDYRSAQVAALWARLAPLAAADAPLLGDGGGIVGIVTGLSSDRVLPPSPGLSLSTGASPRMNDAAELRSLVGAARRQVIVVALFVSFSMPSA